MTRTWQQSPDFDERPQMALPAMTPVTRALLWINGGVFVAFLLLEYAAPSFAAFLYRGLSLDPLSWRLDFPLAPVWQLVTYGFLHSLHDPFHILFNLLGIYFFGTVLEGLIGSRRYLLLYMLAIVLGGALQLGVQLATGPADLDASASLVVDPYPHTVGASGGVLATVVATAVLRPNMLVIFVIFPLKLKVMAMIMVGLDVFNLINGGGGTAYLVHLGGAAWGFAAVRLRWVWFDPVAWWRARSEVKGRERARSDQERLDRLLGQIHDKGMQSLSRGDREFLRRVSGRK